MTSISAIPISWKPTGFSNLILKIKRYSFLATATVGLVALCLSSQAVAAESGQHKLGQDTVEPAIDDSNGNEVYLLTPDKAPLPSKANPVATAPLYLPLYPVTSTVDASTLNCQPTNCDHVNVLPFLSADYGPASAQACADFNGGNPCSLVKGHDHLVGIASTGGDFNVAWLVKLVVFTPKAFADGKINTRIMTLNQMNALVVSGDVTVLDTPITFNCSVTSERTYDLGTPLVIAFP
jgi:hypothetical protein